MKFERSPKIRVDIYGEILEMRKPLYKDVEFFSEVLRLDDPEKMNEGVAEKLEELGLPKKVLAEMEFDHVIDLMQFLQGVKKN